jgi:hypothetical protein
MLLQILIVKEGEGEGEGEGIKAHSAAGKPLPLDRIAYPTGRQAPPRF